MIRRIRLALAYTRVHEGVHAYRHARTRSIHNATHCSARIACHGQSAGVWKPAARYYLLYFTFSLSDLSPRPSIIHATSNHQLPDARRTRPTSLNAKVRSSQRGTLRRVVATDHRKFI